MKVITLNDISKKYRLGVYSGQTLQSDFKSWIARMMGKEDPNRSVAAVNKLASKASEWVWAVKDINLEVEQGEILGVIGKNGAGKTTMLKLLSRITAPTTGQIRIKGRVASLLEVGTGFHPELTGRENIFLNGAILGMTKKEIKSKLDEIVDFSGVEKFIDTPVKRYSRGMYVRLAFAVAAYLEPEILIVDEVLAVGDAEFQKKALGKMNEVSQSGGRTVLYVSHQMNTIENLCTKVVWMEQGMIKTIGSTDEIISQYLAYVSTLSGITLLDRKDRKGSAEYQYMDAWCEDINGNKVNSIKCGDTLIIKARIARKKEVSKPLKSYVSVTLRDKIEKRIFELTSASYSHEIEFGDITTVCWKIPKLTLAEGDFILDFYIGKPRYVEAVDYVLHALNFEVLSTDYYKSGYSQVFGADIFYWDFDFEHDSTFAKL